MLRVIDVEFSNRICDQFWSDQLLPFWNYLFVISWILSRGDTRSNIISSSNFICYTLDTLKQTFQHIFFLEIIFFRCSMQHSTQKYLDVFKENTIWLISALTLISLCLSIFQSCLLQLSLSFFHQLDHRL